MTAKNTLPLWDGMKFQAVVELHWQDNKSLAGVTVKAIEGKHWGGPNPPSGQMEKVALQETGVTLMQ